MKRDHPEWKQAMQERPQQPVSPPSNEVDLFNLTNEPKDLAINQAIHQAVEEWIAGDMENAEHMVGMAEEFIHAPADLFNTR